MLDVPVVRPEVDETTCLGAAYAAGLAVGFWPDLRALRANWRADRTWQPALPEADRDAGLRPLAQGGRPHARLGLTPRHETPDAQPGSGVSCGP